MMIRLFLILSIACIFGCAETDLILDTIYDEDVFFKGKVKEISYDQYENGVYFINGLAVRGKNIRKTIRLVERYDEEHLLGNEFVIIKIIGEYNDGSYLGELIND